MLLYLFPSLPLYLLISLFTYFFLSLFLISSLFFSVFLFTFFYIFSENGPSVVLYGPCCARSVLSRPRANIPRYGTRAQLVRGYYPKRVQTSRGICTPEDHREICPHGHNNLACSTWIINLLLDVLLCSIAKNFYWLFVF